MSSKPSLQPDRCALLALDFTEKIVANYATDGERAVLNAAQACEAASTEHIPVIYVVPGRLQSDARVDFYQGHLHPRLEVREDDLLLAKSKIGAFSTTGLDAKLRELRRDTLVIMGIATSGTVLSTTRWAYDLGYKLWVVADGCSDPDRDIHETLVSSSVGSMSWLGLWRLAHVATTEELVGAIGRPTLPASNK